MLLLVWSSKDLIEGNKNRRNFDKQMIPVLYIHSSRASNINENIISGQLNQETFFSSRQKKDPDSSAAGGKKSAHN